MRTGIWLMVSVAFCMLVGCAEYQGVLRNGKTPHPGSTSASTQGNHAAFSNSVAQEIAAIDRYFSAMKKSLHASGQSLSKKEQGTLKSAKDLSQEGKSLQKKRKSYRALQKVRTIKRMIHPMMTKLWKLGDKRALAGFVNQQIEVVKQRHREVKNLMGPRRSKTEKVIKSYQRSKVLFDEARNLRKHGKFRRAYAKSEDALEALDTVIAVARRDRNS